jgi:hypothetical protein
LGACDPPVLIDLFAAISISFSLLVFLFTPSAYLVLFLSPGESLAASVTSVTALLCAHSVLCVEERNGMGGPGKFVPGKDNA